MPDPTYDPELAALLPALTGQVPVGMTADQLALYRALPFPTIDEQIGDRPVTWADHTIPGYGGAGITVSVIERADGRRSGLGIYHAHGGGMVMADRFASVHPLIDWVLEHDAVAVTVEYRRAPEHPDPVPVEDCYAGLKWTAALGFGRLVVFGGSGGAGLAAGTALLARDRGGPAIAGLLLQCPMLDDRNETVSAREYDGVGVWDRTSNLTAWTMVLGDRRGTGDVSPYAAPARATDLGGLPPVFVDAGAVEVFRDEAVAFASAVWAAGGEAELHVWGGAFHGFHDIAPESAVAKACVAARESWLRRLLARPA
ncbi:alpha/beta hydrolase [Amycolatopsis sp. FBCC-B4732]|uniref:alpha/beta hydrolase fold domain-containing protein n=1 Tax=Amycolatopsis sp. FBCC-B4732 TaxID=3079339 RepID=UPI001FF52EEC|nr:alpha/beta hydrolase fold domain-containing protein [Amycolatopsis sp. FBCC-B4732]UOX91171.1 alpha/beta hydrolase [Amycolatopsis sp. FBCC-B4732]